MIFFGVTLLAASFVSVQVGSYSEEARATHVVEDLRDKGLDAYFLRVPSLEGGESTYKVRVGRFADNGAAHATSEKIKGLGFPGAFAAPTDLAETQGLSADIVALVGAFGAVNPGRIPSETTGKRLSLYVENYVTLFLLADPKQQPGKKLTDLAVWDANPDNQPELFAVVDASRAYALFWQKTQSRFELQELLRGTKVTVGEMLDLAPGPEKFIAIRYEQGGDLYLEKGYHFYRWDQPHESFAEVGRMALDVVDRGEEPGTGTSRKRVILEKKSIDADPDREVLVEDTIEGASKPHLDVWDWHGGRLERVEDPEFFEKLLAANPSSSAAAAGLFGVGIEMGLGQDLEGSEKVFQFLVTKYPGFEESRRAAQAIKQIGERREKSQIMNQTGFDEVRAGAPELGEQDLRAAVVLDPGNSAAWYNLAVARTALSDALGALRALRRALDLDENGTAKLREKAKGDAELAPLREMPEFKEMVQG